MLTACSSPLLPRHDVAHGVLPSWTGTAALPMRTRRDLVWARSLCRASTIATSPRTLTNRHSRFWLLLSLPWQDVARGILPSWTAIAQRRREMPFSEEQRKWQLLR